MFLCLCLLHDFIVVVKNLTLYNIIWQLQKLDAAPSSFFRYLFSFELIVRLFCFSFISLVKILLFFSGKSLYSLLCAAAALLSLLY